MSFVAELWVEVKLIGQCIAFDFLLFNERSDRGAMAFPAPHLYPLNADSFVKYIDNQHNCNTHGNQIRNSGRRFYDGKYKSHFDNLFQSVGDRFKAMDEDPTNK